MKCESCNTKNFEIKEPSEEGQNPYLLCKECHFRLINLALRPLEFFNLVSIHGFTYLLHDDFYDYETGEATQPDINVKDKDEFPFPKFEELKNDLKKLINYSFVQYFIEEKVIEELKTYNKDKILKILKSKVNYNRSINYKAYEIAAKVVGVKARNWITQEWDNRKEDELIIFSEALVNCLEKEKAFRIITSELENMDDKYLSNNISALRFFKDDIVLSWIEKMSPRIINITSNWGQLAASSNFNWQKTVEWLNKNRPLSLIALDALNYCTTKGDRLNQSLWMRKLNPKLIDSPKSEIIAKTLNQYLEIDNVPRTRNTVNRIIENEFEL